MIRAKSMHEKLEQRAAEVTTTKKVDWIQGGLGFLILAGRSAGRPAGRPGGARVVSGAEKKII
mgnify:CR=1 FL=1